MHAERAERLGLDLSGIHVDPVLALEGVRDLLRRDRAERLPLLAGLEREDEGDRIEPLRQGLGVTVRPFLLRLRARSLLRDALQLSGAGLDGETLREQEVLGVPVGDLFHVARAAEPADLLLQDDAHVRSAYAGGTVGDSGRAFSCSDLRSSISHARTEAPTARTPITVSAPMIARIASMTPKKPPLSRSPIWIAPFLLGSNLSPANTSR